MRGRPKTTNAAKRLRGTDQKVRMDKESPSVQPLTVEEITLDDVEGLTTERSKKIYMSRCKTLAAMGIMEEAYQEQLILYSRWLDIALTCSDKIGQDMVMKVFDKEGKITGFVANPYIALFNMATKTVNELGRQFGFSPISRNNIRMVEKQIDPAAELMKLVGG